MKNLIYCISFLCLVVSNYSCKSDVKDEIKSAKDDVAKAGTDIKNTTEELLSSVTSEGVFSVIITEDNSKPHLPELQSFVLATSGDTWLMLAGRTNGMHDFADYTEESFPHQDFNTNIYVCDATACKTMPVSVLPMPYQSMFRATNLQHYQDGNYLYITGGYGENLNPTNNILEDWDTYNFMARIDVSGMIAAVNSGNRNAIIESVIFGEDDAVEATGGELFKMGEYFYLTGGHKFNGVFSYKSKGSSTQFYLDAVHRFKLSESNGKLVVNDFSKITDGLSDSLTQFRRRDLPVTTGLHLKNGLLEPSVIMFSGVFTSSQNIIPGLKSDAAFTNPIHIFNDGTYKLDQSYIQTTNIYAAANFTVYDDNTKTLHSTILGGIGEKNGGHGFTNKVLTINTPLNGGVTTETQQDSIPSNHMFGAESNIILSDAKKIAIGDGVFDITNMNAGEIMQIGTFYGGIESDVLNPGGFGSGLSKASNKLWNISIKKN